ncbi:MAG TPA: glycoside hydrolase family 43 protein [Acidimicrobiales bacterium]|nr:glycoside hydrolase family 43 protein [Acidimicrobiales bacterium]
MRAAARAGWVAGAAMLACLTVQLATPMAAQAQPAAHSVGPVTAPAYDHDAPDPDVVRANGVYFAYTTNSHLENVPVLSSPDLQSWTAMGDALPRLPSWAAQGFSHSWSPGVAQFGATWVMYYTAQVARTGTLCLSVATAPVAAGPFTDNSSGPLACQTNLGGSIDPQPFFDRDGTPYLYWKSNSGASTMPASIWAARLAPDGLSMASSPQEVMTQDQGWEATVESPFMVAVPAGYVLFYSGGLWNSAGYGVGYAVCQSVFGPCVKPLGAPVLHSDQYRLGPGGESLVNDGSGDWFMAYHAWDGPTSRYSYDQHEFRSLWIAPVSFSGTTPVIGAGEAPEGYRMVAADGGVFSFGSASFAGSMGGRPLAAPVVASATDAGTGGYWEVGADGGVFSFGAPFFGSMGGTPLARPVVGMAATPDGGGYWEVASDGGVFAFGDARFFGSMGGTPLARPVVGMAATPDGGGYWLVASDGGLFAFGDARFLGSMGGTPLNAPVVAMASMPQGGGYWLVASDGGVFSFGNAQFFGSMGSVRLNRPVVAMAAGPGSGGYWMVASDGGVFSFGDSAFAGSLGAVPLDAPVVGASAT